MSKLVDLPNDVHKKKLTHGFFEDFGEGVAIIATGTEMNWDLTTTTDGTATYTAAAGGTVAILTDAGDDADNEASFIHPGIACFLCADDKPIVFGCRAKYTEANTDDANVSIGLATVINENTTLGDNGTGPAATYDGFVFWKADGDTTWSVETSFATTQTTTELSAANSLDGIVKTPGAGTYQLLEIAVLPNTSTTCDVLWYMDSVLVARHTNITMTTPAVMYPHAGIKTGDTNAETLTVDYMYCYQTR